MKRNLLIAMLVSIPVVPTFVGCASSRMAGERVDDQTLTRRVSAKLAADPEVQKFRIDVDTLDRKVTLTGNVESASEKQRAERLTYDTRGVEGVHNHLVVNTEAKPEIADGDDDRWITTKVKAKLAADLSLRAFDIDVDTNKGVVRLSGETESREAIEKAGMVALAVDGVKSVENDLTVSEVTDQADETSRNEDSTKGDDIDGKEVPDDKE